MEKDTLNELNFSQEIIDFIRSELSDEELLEHLNDYHENDLAEAFEALDEKERKRLYKLLGAKRFSEIMSYVHFSELFEGVDVEELLSHHNCIACLAKIVAEMDSDDAVSFLEEMDERIKDRVMNLLSDEATADIDLIQSYESDEVGSKITTNYILIQNNLTIRQAMHELVKQAGDNDNISTIYVNDAEGKFYGAIDLKDLIIARTSADLEALISTAYPYIEDREKISDCIERIKDYAEDSMPVLNSEHELIGIITAQDIIEVVDEEMGEDYAKLAGLTSEEDLNEKTFESMKKRLPWLIVLLFLGMAVSSVVGIFENVVAVLPIVICFQSLILDMAGNVGTQSLAVTIRVLMDEQLGAKEKFSLVFKEMRVGLMNGLFLGTMAVIFIGLYVMFFKNVPSSQAFVISGCVGVSLMVAMVVSSLVGTLVPLFFNKINVDPAVASGPLITTVNDLVAVITYYGLSWVILINLLNIV